MIGMLVALFFMQLRGKSLAFSEYLSAQREFIVLENKTGPFRFLTVPDVDSGVCGECSGPPVSNAVIVQDFFEFSAGAPFFDALIVTAANIDHRILLSNFFLKRLQRVW